MNNNEQEARSCKPAVSSNDWVSVLRSRALKGQERLHKSERAISRLACPSASLQRCLDRDDGHRSAPALLHGLSARCASCSCRAFPSTPQQQGRSRLGSTTPGNNNSVAIMAAKLGLDTNTTTSTSCVWTSALQTPCRDDQRPSDDAQASCEGAGRVEALITRTASHDNLLVPNGECGTSNLSVLNAEIKDSPVSGVAINRSCLSTGRQGSSLSYGNDNSRTNRPGTISIASTSNLISRVSDNDDNNCLKQPPGQSSSISGLDGQSSQCDQTVTEHHNVSACSERKTSLHSKSSSSPYNAFSHELNAIGLSSDSLGVNSQGMSRKSKLQGSSKSENFELVPETDARSGSFNSNSTQTNGSCGSACPVPSSELLVTSSSQCQGSTSPKFRTRPKSRTLRNKVLARTLFTCEGPTHKDLSPAHSQVTSPPQLVSLPQLLVPTSCPVVGVTPAVCHSEKADVAQSPNRSSSDQKCCLSNSTAAMNISEVDNKLKNRCEDPIAFSVEGNVSRNSSDTSSTVINDKENYLDNKASHFEQRSIENYVKLNNGIHLQQDLQCNAPTDEVQPSTPPTQEDVSSRSKSPTFQTKTPQGQIKSLRFSTSTPLVHAVRTAPSQHRGFLNSTCAPVPSNLSPSSANTIKITSRHCTPVESAEPVDFPQPDVSPSNVCLSSGTTKAASICYRRPDSVVRASGIECSQLSKQHLTEPAETFVPPVALAESECRQVIKTNPIDILCSPVKFPIKPKLEGLTLPKSTLEPNSERYQFSDDRTNQLACIELSNQGKSLGSPSDSTFQKSSGTLSSEHPFLVQNQTSHDATNNLAASVGEVNHFQSEQTDSPKSEDRTVLQNEAKDAVLTDSSHQGKSFISRTKTPIQTTPRVSKLSLHGLKKLEMLKKKQTPARNFLYPTSGDEPNRKASNLSYTDNIEDSAKFSGFIEADVTTRLPPAITKLQKKQNHPAETHMNRGVKTNSASNISSPNMDLINTKISKHDSLGSKGSTFKVLESQVKDFFKNERKGDVMFATSEKDDSVVPLEIADSIQAWQQNSMSQDMENYLMDMSTQKMICFDEKSSSNVIEVIEPVQRPSTSSDCKEKGQSTKQTLTPTTAGDDATLANVNKRKLTQNSNIDNAPLKYQKISPSLKIPPNENPASARMDIENGSINGMNESKGRLGLSPVSAASAQTAGSSPFSGFSTAGGKHIAVNDAALKKAKMLWSNCDEADSNNAKHQTETDTNLASSLTHGVNDDKWEIKPLFGEKVDASVNVDLNSTSFDSFSSARSAMMGVTETALKKSPLLLEESGVHCSSAIPAAPGAAGFKTARGNVIPLKEKSLRMASRFWSECGENSETSPAISISHMKSAEEFTGKSVDNKLSGTSFAGFKTAKGTSINISEKSVEKALQVLTECGKIEDPNLPPTTFKGFQTAKGTLIPVKEDALKRAKQLMAECSVSEESSSKPTANLGFTTAKGSIIKVGEDALKKAKFLLSDSESVENIDIGPVSSPMAAKRYPIAGREETLSPVPLQGFKTAKGTVIEVPQDALEKAKRLWNDSGQTEEAAGLGFQVPKVSTHKSEEGTIDNPTKRLKTMEDYQESLGNLKVCSDFPTSKGFIGFKTAKGSVLGVDPEAIKKAKALWDSSNDCEDSVVPTNRLDQIRPVDVLPLGKVVRPPVGKTPKRGFIKHKVDTSRISGESCRLPEPASYKGSPCADISARVYPKNVGRDRTTENTKSSWSVPTRTAQPGSECTPMLDKLTADEQEMLNAQLSSIAEEFLQDDDWNIEGEPITTTDCVQSGITSKVVECGSKRGGTSTTAPASRNMPLNETTLSDYVGKDTTPATESSASTGTFNKRADLVKLGEENVDPQSGLGQADHCRGSLKFATAPGSDVTDCDAANAVSNVGRISSSGGSTIKLNGRVPSGGGTTADTCDLKKDAATVSCESPNNLASTNTSTGSTVINKSASCSSVVNPLANAVPDGKLHATSVTTSHDHFKSGSIISVPTPNNFTPFEAPHRTPTKGPPTARGDAASPVILRSRQIKSKIQKLREQYGTPRALSPLQASPVVLKTPFKAPLRPQSGVDSANT